VDAVRQFQFEPGVNWEKNGEILPPPNYTTNALPVNWAWHQNIGLEEVSPEPTVKPELTGPALVQKTELGKTQRDRFSGLDLEIPTKNPHEVPDNANLRSLILAVEEALVERPVWTIRALKNRLAGHPHLVRFKQALRYTSYTLGSGPFRDLVIKYGVDPRTDRKYYKYQVMAFNNVDFDDFGSGIVDNAPQSESENLNSHVFDGKRLDLDKKLWQLCDVTEPFLAKLIDSVAFREQFELVHDGWICNGSWVKVHLPSVMSNYQKDRMEY
jgi:general transcription factor 3C polypeptide 5 (transcription factor C subunit 1)